MIGSIISAGVGIGSSIFGGIKARKQKKKMEAQLKQQEADNQAWYNANALSDYTQRADSQNLIRNLRETLSKENKVAANSAVVTGATPEQQAVQKEQANKVISDTYANLGAMGQQWKDSITDRYLDQKNNLAGQRMDMMNQSAQSYSNMMMNGLNTATSGAGGMLGGLMGG